MTHRRDRATAFVQLKSCNCKCQHGSEWHEKQARTVVLGIGPVVSYALLYVREAPVPRDRSLRGEAPPGTGATANSQLALVVLAAK